MHQSAKVSSRHCHCNIQLKGSTSSYFFNTVGPLPVEGAVHGPAPPLSCSLTAVSHSLRVVCGTGAALEEPWLLLILMNRYNEPVEAAHGTAHGVMNDTAPLNTAELFFYFFLVCVSNVGLCFQTDSFMLRGKIRSAFCTSNVFTSNVPFLITLTFSQLLNSHLQ